MIDPKTTVAWPEHLRLMWIGARWRRCAARNRRHLELRGGRFREWQDLGEPVG